MSQGVKSSLPSHLNKPSRLSPDSAGGDGDDQFERKHGKTRSYMVSRAPSRVGTPPPLRSCEHDLRPTHPRLEAPTSPMVARPCGADFSNGPCDAWAPLPALRTRRAPFPAAHRHLRDRGLGPSRCGFSTAWHRDRGDSWSLPVLHHTKSGRGFVRSADEPRIA